jgi:O-antigen/teichoic acid export membrane protein
LTRLIERSRGGHSLLATDQIMSSASSAVYALVTLALATEKQYGLFAIGTAVLGIVIGIGRAGVLEGLIVRSGTNDPTDYVREARLLVSIIAVLGCASTFPLGMLGFGMSWPLATSFALVALGSVLIDIERYAAFAKRNYGVALRIDTLWLGSYGATLGALAIAKDLTFLSAIVAYFATALITFAVVLARRGGHFDIGRAQERMVLHRDLRFGVDFTLNVSSGYLIVLLIPALASVSALGAYRAVLTLFQPLGALAYAPRSWYLARKNWLIRPRQTFIRTLAAVAALCALYGAMTIAGYQIFPIRHLSSFVNTSVTAVGLAAAAELARIAGQTYFDGFRILRRVKPIVFLRGIQLGLLVLLTVVLGPRFGLIGFLWARFIAYAFPVLLGWIPGLRLPKGPVAEPQ